MGRGRLARHWIAPLTFVPFGVMLLVHRSLGLSDAMFAAPPGEPVLPPFNVAMVLVFYLGVGGYLAHTFWMSDRGWAWVAVKYVALAIAWTGMIVALQSQA